MRTRYVSKIAILGFLWLILAGCSDSNPQVQVLRALDDLTFNPQSIVTSSLTSVPIQARCAQYVNTIEMSLDGGATWLSPSAYDNSAASSCKDGKFQVQLSNLKAPWNTMNITSGQTLKVKFRAQPRPGHYFYKEVEIQYTPSTSRSQDMLVGSATEQNGSGLRLKSRLRTSSQHVATGGNFRIQGRITE
nr:hypothetical protein CKG001_28080 [Bdellovibrio sp. CKG001]BFD64115.1 hypothetical protein BdHM001_27960 [Bdellovibrio sp. HM001]